VIFLFEKPHEKLTALKDEYRIQLDIEEDPFFHVEEFRVFSVKQNLDITDEYKS
jgi:hypothetical protein